MYRKKATGVHGPGDKGKQSAQLAIRHPVAPAPGQATEVAESTAESRTHVAKHCHAGSGPWLTARQAGAPFPDASALIHEPYRFTTSSTSSSRSAPVGTNDTPWCTK